jgi:hypothetical protein
MSFIIAPKIHKISFIITFSIYLLRVPASQGHHQAIVNCSKSLHCMCSHVYTYIYMLLLHVIVLENVRPHFPHAIFVLRHSRCVPLCVVFLGRACPLYSCLKAHKKAADVAVGHVDGVYTLKRSTTTTTVTATPDMLQYVRRLVISRIIKSSHVKLHKKFYVCVITSVLFHSIM